MTQIKKTHNIVVFRLLINKTEHGLIFILQYAAGREPNLYLTTRITDSSIASRIDQINSSLNKYMIIL